MNCTVGNNVNASSRVRPGDLFHHLAVFGNRP